MCPARHVTRWGSRISIVAAILLVGFAAGVKAEEELDPLSLTKYLDPLPVPGIMPQAAPNYYEIGAWEIQQQLHSELPPTTVYGYGVSQATASYPGATIVTQKGVPISIRWTNHLPMTHILEYAFDPTIPKAETSTGIPITPHVHGAEVEPQSDGGPMTWFTAGFAETGPDWTKEVLNYANNQLPATIWYHDHAFGYTRHNVYAGLAGYYLVTDPEHEPIGLPSGSYDMGLCIQDRMFTTEGQLWYPNEGETWAHPVWIPEFFGNVILVNGKVWPYLNVEPRKYRFRFLNGSQARFYSLAIASRLTGEPGPAFYQIGSDGGYLDAPVVLNDPADVHSPRLLIAPGERCDVIIDFSGYVPGTELLLRNNAKAPYPRGESPEPNTVGEVMLFRVVPLTTPDTSVIPSQLTTVNRLTSPTVTRVMTLNEIMTAQGPTGALLNGMSFHGAPATEYPELGATELWEIVNMTGDTHPIHLHLVQFQMLNRQKLNVRRYERAWHDANPAIPAQSYAPVPVEPYLRGAPTLPDANEQGWKDTFRMNPGEVTRILVRFSPQDESLAFAFDATAEPGYVWHCHILEHEENDMMRPYHLVTGAPGIPVMATGSSSELPATPSAGAELWLGPRLSGNALDVHFRIPTEGPVALDLYDLTGRRVQRLADEWFEAGEHTVSWKPRNASGGRLSAGIYFVHLSTGDAVAARKVVMIP